MFLSPRVNAAVFYDLSVLNLLFPSRKNLEIGLGLVNAVSLGELKAVLAHEFGHFGQRSMAVGRWVYIAQQIAGHIIAKRDALDSFLRGLSRVDLRIAWVGWLLSLIVWSIRSLMETVFRLVVLAQRALSREMELQADLVAVSLTGSDALIHALYKLNVADEAWERALAFADSEARDKRSVADLFAVQKHITEKLRHVLTIRATVRSLRRPRTSRRSIACSRPARAAAAHVEHASGELRARAECQAPVHSAAIDERSAWELFDGVPDLKKRMTAHVFRAVQEAADVPLEQSLAKLDEQFGRAYYDRSYRGAYLGRRWRCTRAKSPALRSAAARRTYRCGADAIYPQALSQDLAKLKALEEDKATLQGLKEGFLTASGGVLRYRGKDLKRADLQTRSTKCRASSTRHAKRCSPRQALPCRASRGREPARAGMGCVSQRAGRDPALRRAQRVEPARRARRSVQYRFRRHRGRPRVIGERRVLLNACAEVHNALRHI